MSGELRALVRRTPFLFHAAKMAQAALVGARRATWRTSRRGLISRYLAGRGPHGLTLGTGHQPPAGWLNTDLDPRVAAGVIFLDATQPFPFPDASFDRIHTEHMIEHVPLPAGRAMLAEASRVLRPGGRVRIATPDLARLAGLVANPGGDPAGAAYLRWFIERFTSDGVEPRVVDVLNHAMRAWGHVFLYDEATLREELTAAGFVSVTRYALNESDDPGLRGLESHAESVGGGEHIAWSTMVLEAVRPH
jgi:predicted SAM-dependent methyltransferase